MKKINTMAVNLALNDKQFRDSLIKDIELLEQVVVAIEKTNDKRLAPADFDKFNKVIEAAIPKLKERANTLEVLQKTEAKAALGTKLHGELIARLQKAMASLNGEKQKAVQGTKQLTAERIKLLRSYSQSRKDAVEEIKNFKILGTSFNDIQKVWNKSATALNLYTKVLGKARIAMIALGATPILVVLSAIVLALQRSQKAMDAMSNVTAGFGASLDAAVGPLVRFGEALVTSIVNPLEFAARAQQKFAQQWELFKKNPVQYFKNLASDVGEYVDSVGEAYKAGVLMDQQLQEIERSNIDLERTFVQNRAAIAQFKKDAEDTTKTYEQRAAAYKKAYDLELDISVKREASAEKLLNLAKYELDQKKKNGTALNSDYQKVLDAERRLSDLKQNSLELQTTLQNALNTLTAEQVRKLEAARDKLQAINDEIREGLTNFRIEGNPVAQLQEQQRQAIEGLEKMKIEAIEAAKALGLPVETIIADIDKLILLTSQKYEKDVRKLFGVAALGAEEGVNEIGTVISESTSIEGILASKNEEAKAGGTEIAFYFKSGLEQGLDDVEEFFEKALDKLAEIANGEKFIAFQQLSQNLASSFIEGIDAQLAALDKLRQANEDKINDLEDNLKLQQSLQEQGFANNVNGLQRELDEKLALEAEYAEKAAEIQKRQATISLINDSIQQSSSLITASANIFKAFSFLPAFVGVPLAVAAIATMFGAFAKAKIDAFKAVNDTSLYTGTDGASIESFFGKANPTGKSDKHGGKGYRVVDSDTGRPTGVKISGKEAIVDERTTDIVYALLKDVKKQPSLYAGRDLVADLARATKVSGEAKNTVMNTTILNGGISKVEIESALRKVFKEHQEFIKNTPRTSYVAGDVKTKIVEQGDNVTIIKVR